MFGFEVEVPQNTAVVAAPVSQMIDHRSDRKLAVINGQVVEVLWQPIHVSYADHRFNYTEQPVSLSR